MRQAWQSQRKTLPGHTLCEQAEAYSAGPNAWVTGVEEVKARGYDLTARNPYRTSADALPPPLELTSRLLERVRELHDIIEGLHEKLGNGES